MQFTLANFIHNNGIEDRDGKNLMRQAFEQSYKECYANGSILASTDDVVSSLCIVWS